MHKHTPGHTEGKKTTVRKRGHKGRHSIQTRTWRASLRHSAGWHSAPGSCARCPPTAGVAHSLGHPHRKRRTVEMCQDGYCKEKHRFNFCVLQNTATPTPQFSQRGINRGGGTPPKQGCPIFGPVQCTGFKIFAPSPAEMAKMLFWHIWLLFSGCFISSENAYSFWRKVLEGNLPWGDSGQQHPDLNHISALAAQGSHQGNCALAGHPALWILTTSCGGP